METRSFLELVESRFGSLLVVTGNVAAAKTLGSCTYGQHMHASAVEQVHKPNA